MKVEVTLATAGESQTIASLMQLYLYEFPYIDDLELGDDGRFTYHFFERYWSEEGRYPFLIRADQRLSGFAFVVDRAILEPATAGYAMAEFFILRRYRRRGVGRAAACALFERFRGPWWVAEHIRNEPAQAFWRAAIGQYTGGIFSEDVTTYYGEPAVVQTFDSPRI